MNGDRFDRRLLMEIEAAVGRGAAAGRALAAVGAEDKIPVTITHPELLRPRSYKDRGRTFRSLDSEFDRVQAPVGKFLQQIGAANLEKLPLSNSWRAELSVTQLQQLDENRELLNDIDAVRLVKEDDVLCLHQSAQVIEARRPCCTTSGMRSPAPPWHLPMSRESPRSCSRKGQAWRLRQLRT